MVKNNFPIIHIIGLPGGGQDDPREETFKKAASSCLQNREVSCKISDDSGRTLLKKIGPVVNQANFYLAGGTGHPPDWAPYIPRS